MSIARSGAGGSARVRALRDRSQAYNFGPNPRNRSDGGRRSVAGNPVLTRSQQNDLLNQEIAYELRRCYDYYDWFWQGLGEQWMNTPEQNHFARFYQYPIPRATTPVVFRVSRALTFPYHQQPDRDVDPELKSTLNAQLQAGAHPTTQALTLLGLRYVKILGAGSQGVAVLFEMDNDDGTTRQVVAKYDTGDQDDSDSLRNGGNDDGLLREKNFMRDMVGARHVIQRYFINGFDVIDDNRPNADNNTIYIMEFMKHGTLDGLLRKVSLSQPRVQLRSSDLWRIFLCMFRACVAMSYPQRWLDGRAPERGDPVPVREELVPTDDAGNHIPPPGDAIVNFDMNYNNIMVGDYDTDPGVHPHDQVPVFKVGDLGICNTFPPRLNVLFAEIVFCRICGNSGTKTPEQFTTTWDAFASLEDMYTRDDTAGRYGWWTNLYQAAVIMTSLITQHIYDRPPVGTVATIRGLMDQDFSVYTYSGHLLKDYFNQYDMNLRMTIAWCMAHVPSQRPSMTQLQDILMRAESAVFNEEGRTSIADILGSPPPPPPPPPSPPGAGRDAGGIPQDLLDNLVLRAGMRPRIIPTRSDPGDQVPHNALPRRRPASR